MFILRTVGVIGFVEVSDLAKTLYLSKNKKKWNFLNY